MYFLQVIIVKNFYSFSKQGQKQAFVFPLYLIITERAEYQKIVYYMNKKPGR